MKKVSVIIPAFNSQETLARAVLSVVYEPLVSEIFIVDDGSTDDSREIAQRLAMKFSFIHLLQHPDGENKGGAASRNLGLSYATSEWIQFLDADDELLPGKIGGQLNLTTSEVAFVVGNSIHVFPDGRKSMKESDRDIWTGLIISKLGDTCANLWNKKFLLEVGGWNEMLSSSQEYDLMFRITKINQNLRFTSEFSTIVHKRPDSISTSPDLKNQRVENWLNLRLKIKEFLTANKLFTLNRKYFYYSYVRIFCTENGVDYVVKEGKLYWYCYSMILRIKKMLYEFKA